MASLITSEMDSYATDSVASSPRSDALNHQDHARVRFMCSFGGKIVPRPHDNQLRYVGGDTRIVALHRSVSFSSLLSKLSKLTGTSNVVVKYQLPSEDLDALISVTTDEDVENMMDEYDRVALNQNPRATRLRLFLFPKDEEFSSGNSGAAIATLNRDHWFIDALNSSSGGGGGGPPLERNRSEASSIVSEVPDYLFGLDNSDELAKIRTRPVFQDSDPGSPAPPQPVVVVPSQFSSIPNLPPVKTRPETTESFPNPNLNLNQNQNQNPVIHYVQQPGPNPNYHHHPMPVYYVQAPPPPAPVQHMPYIPVQYPVQGYSAAPAPQPVQGLYRPASTVQAVDPRDASPRVVTPISTEHHHVLYGVRSQGFPAGMVVASSAGGEDPAKTGKVLPPHSLS